MNNLIDYNYELADENKNLYLYFNLGENKYAVSIKQVVEIIKLPCLDYPQRLPNNIVGLLNYNNFTINILDLRFYLNIEVTPYSVSNQIIVVKTDESIFGLLVNSVENIFSPEQESIGSFRGVDSNSIIEFLCKDKESTVSIISLNNLEALLKEGVSSVDFDIPSLFPQDDDSKYKMMQRNLSLVEKFEASVSANIFSQDKFISFALCDSIYCINLEFVCEFLKNSSVTNVPCTPDYIQGVVAIRGDFVTVINLKEFLGLDTAISNSEILEDDSKSRIIVVEYGEYKIGFLVDEIFSIVDIPEALLSDASLSLGKYFFCEVILDKILYTVLDIKSILADDKFFIEEKV